MHNDSHYEKASKPRSWQFESSQWTSNYYEDHANTPAVTPSLSQHAFIDSSNAHKKLTPGVHWDSASYPAWVGIQPPKISYQCPASINQPHSSGPENAELAKEALEKELAPPFKVEYIATVVDEIRQRMGFQFDASVSVFELLMSQLDSRASRSCPQHALKSLHMDYISGSQANYRKWYFAAQMDKLDQRALKASSICKSSPDLEMEPVSTPPRRFFNQFAESTSNNCEEDYVTLADAEAAWDLKHSSLSNHQRLTDLLIYLFCWTEANQVRFMPECLAFIVKASCDYYNANFSTYTAQARDATAACSPHKDLRPGFFLDSVITPIYECYRSYNYCETADRQWVRKEGDHKDFIGYDDMNQLFWYQSGIRRLCFNPGYSENAELLASGGVHKKSLLDMPPERWYLVLQDILWTEAFAKTYRESRTWLHNITNFSRIWTLHASIFWFYTSFNAPTIYTTGYNYMNPHPPKEFVRFTIMSLGGLVGPLITLLGLIGELRFVPRSFPGAKPVLFRFLIVLLMLCLLLIPALCNLLLNPWDDKNLDMMPATVVSGVLFALATLYTVYFSFQPLESLLGSLKTGTTPEEADANQRRFLANSMFTACFPKQHRNGEILSWVMCLLTFTAKFLESYFYLTLSVRDPIHELSIMDLQDRCIGDKYLSSFICAMFPKFTLVAVILTDLTLFFLDTYLWYVIFSTVISISIAFKQGTSIWSPWRNVYSRLPQRISTKLLAPSMYAVLDHSRAFPLRIIWDSIVDCMYRSHLINQEQALKLMQVNSTTQEPHFFAMEEDGKALGHSSKMQNAHRRISFFAQSLSTPMQPSLSIEQMPAFTVLIPHYKEKMVLSLRDSIKADADAKITILEYLQRLYPHEWINFVDDLQRSSAQTECVAFPPPSYTGSPSSPSTSSISGSSVGTQASGSTRSHQIALRKLGFSTLDPNDTEKTRLWCSERTQTLFRTLKGFANYYEALRILSYAESFHAQSLMDTTGGTPASSADPQKLSELCTRKFRLLVSMQLYADFNAEQLQDVETLLSTVPELTVCYVEHDISTNSYFSCMFDKSCPLLDTGKRKPKLRIRLSGNPILGDGKSDNQNSALPFYRGEYIQLIDANQDNYLEECLKIRNILMEFEADTNGTPSTTFSAFYETRPDLKNGDYEAQIYDEYHHSTILSTQRPPVAIVGAREYIFSENIGILGDVAAGKEQTFGTLFSRTLAKIGAKLHYGHPDFINAIFATTRGGVSKGQRGLHLNEDIYAGMTAILRGGRIRHCEYFQCGKGRELGFTSVLNFTAKIGAGMGEQMLSREYFYMGTQLPFDRFMSFYYAHPGFHLNNVFIMLSLEMLLTLILWISSIASVTTICNYDRSNPLKPHSPAGCTNVLPLIDWIKRCVISIFLVFFISLSPLIFQEFMEKGILKSVARVLRHFGSLSMLFEVFSCRVYARSFWENMSLGGARYMATGRNMATARVSIKFLYSSYYPEIITGLQGAAQLWYASVTLWSPSYLWFWMTTFSLCMCPFLYNPHQFAFTDFFCDYQQLLLWFWNSVESSSSKTPQSKTLTICESWTSFNRVAREKISGIKRRTSSMEASRPTLRNSLLSQVGPTLLRLVCLAVPYFYVSTQKMQENNNWAPQDSALLRLCLVACIPVVINCVIVAICLVASLLTHACLKTAVHANVLAFVVHTLSLFAVIASWWALYILESQQWYSTMLGSIAIYGLHTCMITALTALIWRQRSKDKTSDPWWTGNWANAKLGWKLPLIIAEEFFLKSIVEPLEYTYDFLACHTVMCVQLPLVLIPGIDKLHTLFLMWLRPSVTAAASTTVHLKRKHQSTITARVYSVCFIAVVATLITSIILPLYLPRSLMAAMETKLVRLAAW